MEEPLYTFSADNSAAVQAVWIAVIISLGALAGMVALLKTKSEARRRNQNMLLAMLLFFAVMISGGTAFFSWMKIRKTGPVAIYKSAVETPYGKVAFSTIKDAYIHADREPSLVDPARAVRTTNMLVIEEKNGKTHILSEQDYPIKEILPALKDTFAGWQKERK